MIKRNFRQMLENQWSQGNFVCVGLDSEFGKIPESAYRSGELRPVEETATMIAFNRAVIEATKDIVCAYKPNIAFYEAYGAKGFAALQRTIMDIYSVAPDVPVILDAKRADIGNTNIGYASSAFDYFGADAITLHPFLGAEALQPFLNREDKGAFILCRTSNPGAGEFQDMDVSGDMVPGGYMPLYKYVAYRVSRHWNKNGNCGLVVGATYPDELREVREIAYDVPILIPGIGAQGGDIEATVKAGKDSHGRGMIVNSSRGIIFASKGADFAEAARRETEKLRDAINRYR